MNDKSGIYSITNKVNNKRYIGQSKNIPKRWKEHLSGLKGNRHENNYLQNSWNKYGEENFKFEVIEYCDLEELDIKEDYYIQTYNTMDDNFGYNLQSGGRKNITIRESTRQKLAEAGKKSHMNYKTPTGKDNPLYGTHLSKEVKEKISKSRLGMKMSDEAKKQMSIRNTGSNNPNCVAIYCPELDESFWGAKEAQDKYGFNKNHISYCIHGKRKHAGVHPITGEKLTWVKLENK